MQLDEQIRLNESRSYQHLHQHAGNCHGHILIMWYLAVNTKQPAPLHEGMNISYIYHTIPLVKCAHRQVEQMKGFELIFPMSATVTSPSRKHVYTLTCKSQSKRLLRLEATLITEMKTEVQQINDEISFD